MKNQIKLLKNNDERTDTDLEWVDEFYKFLQGEIPEGMRFVRGHKVCLSPKKAMSIIWYLQEHFSILPDSIEKCDVCDRLFDSYCEGIFWESKLKHFCGGCDHLVPMNYDKGKR